MSSLNIPSVTELSKTFSSFITSDKVNSTALPQNREKKTDKFEKNYGMLYTTASVIAGIGIIHALYKGRKIFSFSFLKNQFTKYKLKTADTFNKFSQHKFLGKIRYLTGFTTSFLGQKLFETGNFLANFKPLKDTAIDRTTKFIKVKPIFDKIQQLFTSSAKKLTLTKYRHAENDFLNFQKCLNEISKRVKTIPIVTVNGAKLTGEQFARKIQAFSSRLSNELSNITNAENFSKRFDNMVNTLNEHSEEKFLANFSSYKGDSWLQKTITKLRECTDFLPEKSMKEYEKTFFENLNLSKMRVSNNVLDLHSTISKSIDDIFYKTAISNDELRKAYFKIQNLLPKFKEPAQFNVVRADIRTEILKELQNIEKEFSKQTEFAEKTQKVRKLIKLIQNDNKGLTEEAVSACKCLKTIDMALYNRLIKARNKFQKSLNNAVTFETEKGYKKLLDYSLHSLTADILSTLLGTWAIGYIIFNKKQSKEEKVSMNLEKGIPIIGGLAVSFLSNMRMVASGTGALCLGIISGFALNRIGNVINDWYIKKITDAKIQKPDNTSQVTNKNNT